MSRKTILLPKGRRARIGSPWIFSNEIRMDEAAKALQDLTAEYETNRTREARLAHDADKLETLLQAREYEAQGYDTAAWRQTSVTALRTEEGQELARAISATPAAQW